ncbi:MAG: EamA family transporter [Bryobacteraceae bacterium]|nr:EamA family transporter [Bryobacteraceae bacterium]
MESRQHPLFPAYAALAAVCFFWGTTYLGIRMALESFAPLWLMAFRFTISGSVLLITARLLGAPIPTGRELAWTALYGILPLGVANGALTFSETFIPSSLAALYITTAPFWMVGIEALVPGGEKLHLRTMAAMMVGFLGTSLLVMPEDWSQGFSAANIQGFLLLQVGNCAWAAGSILFRRRKTKAHPVVSGAVQQLATGLVMCGLVGLTSPPAPQWSGRGLWAAAYLVVFGSIVAYSAYVYVLNKLPISIVSIYTYINPLVAAALGWLFYREPFGWRETLAMAVIFLGVFLVKKAQSKR